ncbi:MAG: exonuclease subunit SbcD [Candidatus Calescibacterium sp.]|nr:exonuclease subunit SbcD [Candidatus Calescibacterium sp.]MCX7972193.1 exonuclease subunit SbcD [bacterium]MDW8194883.1 exonuclease subunit SbcD [Candidatus Calescibacterium sp.]
MRFIHIADLHLGKKIKTVRGDIELDFCTPLKDIVYIIKDFQPAFLFISGDIFHYKNPSQDSEELFIEFLINAYENVDYTFVISGNHDNSKKLSNIGLFNEYINRFSNRKIFIYTDMQLRRDIESDNLTPLSFGDVDIFMIPFIEYRSALSTSYNLNIPKEYAYSYIHNIIISKYLEKSKSKIKFLLSHIYVEDSVIAGSESKNFINTIYYVKQDDIDNRITYGALGHIHKFQKIGSRNLFYSGSIIPLDFSENFDHGIILGEVVNGFPNISFQKLSYKEFVVIYENKNINIFEEVQKNADKYVKIVYENLDSETIEKLIKFDNVIKIQKISSEIYHSSKKIEYDTIDYFDVLQMYEKYYEIEKSSTVEKKVLDKLDEILRSESDTS